MRNMSGNIMYMYLGALPIISILDPEISNVDMTCFFTDFFHKKIIRVRLFNVNQWDPVSCRRTSQTSSLNVCAGR